MSRSTPGMRAARWTSMRARELWRPSAKRPMPATGRTTSYGSHAAHVAVDPRPALSTPGLRGVETSDASSSPLTLAWSVRGRDRAGSRRRLPGAFHLRPVRPMLTVSFMTIAATATDFSTIRAVALEERLRPTQPLAPWARARGQSFLGRGGRPPRPSPPRSSSLSLQPPELPLSAAACVEMIRSELSARSGPRGCHVGDGA